MKRTSPSRFAWAAALLAAILPLVACGAATQKQAPVGFVDSMAAVMPTFTCLDSAPGDKREEKTKCLRDAGIPEEALRPQPSSIPDPALILLPALIYGAAPGVQYTPEIQQRALDHARCIENGARDVRINVPSETTYFAAQAKIIQRCGSLARIQKSMMTDQASVDIADQLTFLLGNLAERLTIDYYARTNLWYPKALEPCVRYLDGRPPSQGCAGKPEPRAPAPPTR